MRHLHKMLWITLAVAGVVLLVVVRRAFAQPPGPCTGAKRIFRAEFPGTNGIWHFANNWSGQQLPGAAETVCIPPGSTVWISNGICAGGSQDGQGCAVPDDCPGGACQTTTADTTVANAAAIRVLAGPFHHYGLRIEYGGSPRELKLSGRADGGVPVTSRLDSYLYVDAGCKLVVENSLTIEGDGGVFEGEFLGEPPLPRPTISGPGTLTIRSTIPNQYDFRCSVSGAVCYPDVACPTGAGVCKGSVMVTESWNIDAPFVNEGSVVATHPSGIRFTGGVSGNGVWRASNFDAQPSLGAVFLGFDGPLSPSGGGLWEIGPDTSTSYKWRAHPDAIIRLEDQASLPGFTGMVVQRSEGTLEVNTNAIAAASSLAVYSGTLELNAEVASQFMDVEVHGGLLEFNQSFDTWGDLVIDGGTIKVTAGKQAYFD